MKKKKFSLSTTQVVLLSFLATILFGGILLTLPISVKDGARGKYVDALFTAITSTCVTGLSPPADLASPLAGQDLLLWFFGLSAKP